MTHLERIAEAHYVATRQLPAWPLLTERERRYHVHVMADALAVGDVIQHHTEALASRLRAAIPSLSVPDSLTAARIATVG